MKILVVGDWHSELHEEPLLQALLELGHDAKKFSWFEYFKPADFFLNLLGPYYKLQNKFLAGPTLKRLNSDFIYQAKELCPQLIFIYRGTHIYPSTLRKIREQLPAVTIVGYNNDDPFSPKYPRWQWRHFKACLPEYDLVFAYRHHNLEDFQRVGARSVALLRSWFVPTRNYPMMLSDEDAKRYDCDVVFVGHYENDGRLAYLEDVVKAGWKLKIFGPSYGWDVVLKQSSILTHLQPVKPVLGVEYNKAICGAKVALCFFSRLNRDTYTRRCFEIPATGTLMMSEYSFDLDKIFEDGQEVILFHDVEEMRESMKLALTDNVLRRRIAEAGLKRVWSDGHDVLSRMEYMLKVVELNTCLEA